MEKFNTFDSVKFILYTIQDAKTLAGCSNMELFAPHVINEKLVLGFTFLCVCKISHTKPSPALMFAPAHSMEFLINDDSGSVHAIMSPRAMESSSHLAGAPAKLGMCDNTQSIQLEKFQLCMQADTLCSCASYTLITCDNAWRAVAAQAIVVEALMNTEYIFSSASYNCRRVHIGQAMVWCVKTGHPYPLCLMHILIQTRHH